MEEKKQICVLGAGIVGMTTAFMMKEKHTKWDVTIIADKFEQDTLSDIAAGIFRPSTSFKGPTSEITKQWLVDAYHHYKRIQITKETAEAGVQEVSGYVLSSKFPEVTKNQFLEDLLPVYRRANELELKICPGDWKYGAFFTTLVIESRYHLPWLRNKFERLGGKIVKKTINSFQDVEDYDLVINCTGFGAKKLCVDHDLVPIRGQVFKVKAPWVKMFFYGDYDTYIIPGIEYVTLGGCRQFDSFKEEVDKYDSASIWERCTELLPNLKSAEVIREVAGLRPHRTPVRVEKDVFITSSGKRLDIVHHYGHGGYGVTTAPGTAKYAVQLAEEVLSGIRSNIHSKL
ncbi:D-aspartate oxidase-like [Daphnia pulicaria]|uniref:D-aspartate oxidase-like n=1 Tax=Daphnia pulicaria TaxID=35523 RepID=UPI001EECDBE9|nr:D-aspartate oxidase-like [Daphnia pulicaria]XP_046652867.1 D-aspartate oxidase-like [Daphnia pulicaria]